MARSLTQVDVAEEIAEQLKGRFCYNHGRKNSRWCELINGKWERLAQHDKVGFHASMQWYKDNRPHYDRKDLNRLGAGKVSFSNAIEQWLRVLLANTESDL